MVGTLVITGDGYHPNWRGRNRVACADLETYQVPYDSGCITSVLQQPGSFRCLRAEHEDDGEPLVESLPTPSLPHLEHSLRDLARRNR